MPVQRKRRASQLASFSRAPPLICAQEPLLKRHGDKLSQATFTLAEVQEQIFQVQGSWQTPCKLRGWVVIERHMSAFCLGSTRRRVSRQVHKGNVGGGVIRQVHDDVDGSTKQWWRNGQLVWSNKLATFLIRCRPLPHGSCLSALLYSLLPKLTAGPSV